MLKTIIVSLITSLIVCFITFALGLKSGKNQTDRAKLQELYRHLLIHFQTIKKGIEQSIPKEWQDYKSIETMNSKEHFPLVKELKSNGNLIYIKDTIAKEAELLELDCMRLASKSIDIVNGIHAIIQSNPHFYTGGLITTETLRLKSGSHISTANNSCNNSFRNISYTIFCNPTKLRDCLRQWKTEGYSYALSFSTRGNPPERKFVLFPLDLKDDVEHYADQVLDIIEKNVEGYQEYITEERVIIERLECFEKVLSRKAKEPIRFWETFGGAFMDIFK